MEPSKPELRCTGAMAVWCPRRSRLTSPIRVLLLGCCLLPTMFADAQETPTVATIEEAIVTDEDGRERVIRIPRDGDIWPDRVLISLVPQVEYCACDQHRAAHSVQAQVADSNFDMLISSLGLAVSPMSHHHHRPTLTESVARADMARERRRALNPARAQRETGAQEDRTAIQQELLNSYVAWLPDGTDPNAVVTILQGDAAVLVAEPAAVIRTSAFDPLGNPDDPLFYTFNSFGQGEELGDLWAIHQVNPIPAWKNGYRGAGLVAAIIDTGVDIGHQDLAPNFDLDPAEPFDGIDNDGNGFVDDAFRSWNFWDDNPAAIIPCFNIFTQQYELGWPCDDGTHGSHVAALALGTSNAAGMLGVAPGMSVRSAKAFSVVGFGSPDIALNAVQYASDEGADLLGNSYAFPHASDTYTSILSSSLTFAYYDGIVVVAAAGNTGTWIDHIPASKPLAIVVAALSPVNTVAPDSSFGSSVDIAAPGGRFTGPCSCMSPFGTFFDSCNAELVLSAMPVT